MSIRTIQISGLRGFADTQTLDLAIPDNEKNGSGLTVLVGPNNGGKSTVVEALKALSYPQPTSFAIGRRNQRAGSKVALRAVDQNGAGFLLRTVDGGGSETIWEKPGEPPSIFVLPSRRFFSPWFGQHTGQTRHGYITGNALPGQRGNVINEFAGRLFAIQKDRGRFDELLNKVLDPLPTWTIDQSDAGYFLRFEVKGAYHSSEGLGEGLVSLLFIVDALYDAPDGSTVVIDEPELSLHPSVLRKLSALFSEWSKTHQLVLATHSAYFVDLHDIVSGSQVARVYLQDSECRISALSRDTVDELDGFLKNLHNPHVFGTDAREVFFLSDGIILVEGQDDVIFYRRIAHQLDKCFAGDFFGWGVGGAGNMTAIAGLLKDLGFAKVVGILDANKIETLKLLTKKFPEYQFFPIPADDVRSKPARDAVPAVSGLLDEKGTLKAEYKDETVKLIDRVNEALSNSASANPKTLSFSDSNR